MQFGWPTAFCPITQEPEFCQIWDCNINNVLVFILDYFQEKLITKFFKKSKKSYFGAILPKSGQKRIFPEKRAPSVFKYSNNLP